ncbi:abortive infection bacteriophage resistance protein [Clostridiales Family XIII bacterium PM5-7]
MHQYPKQILTISQQVQSYVDAEMEIASREDVENALKSIGLYQILLAMKYLKSSDEEWGTFIDKMDQLIQNSSSVIDYTAINFPTDWKTHLRA